MQIPVASKIAIPIGQKALIQGEIRLPVETKGMVVFSYGGTDKFSSQHTMVADYLVQQEFGVLLFDLLTPEEDQAHPNRFNIRLLAERLMIASNWLSSWPPSRGLHQAFYGTGNGAAAALYAAAAEGTEIAAVISRGGRPDLVIEVLPSLQSPTLLIVGANDTEVMQLNREAYALMNCVKKLEVLPNTSQLFDEKGAMEEVCILTAFWLEQYLHPLRMLVG